MLKQVVLQTSTPVTLDIEAADPDDTLLVKSISGLTQTKVTLFTGEYARNGGYYQGRRATGMNPVFTFRLNPDYKNNVEVSDIREMLYRWFHEPTPTADGLMVVLKDDRKPDRYFVGYTESVNADHFDKKQEAQVSMVVTDAYLKSVLTTTASDVTGWTSVPVTYDGSADTGLTVKVKVKTATATITVDLNGQVLALTKASGTFAVNDIVDINTVEGSRSIKVNGVDAMGIMTAASKWLTLNQTNNTLKTYGTASGDGKAAIMNYSFQSAWWGI